LNARLIETTRVLRETLEEELKKMVTKEEFHGLEQRHEALRRDFDKLAATINTLQDQIDQCKMEIKQTNKRVDGVENSITE
jgi:peptidoglycan hydrolase CwlO-like protein